MIKIIKVAKKYEGCRKYSDRHRKLIQIFNTVKPNGYTAHISDPWCAEGISAWAIEAYGKDNAKKYFPLSASVPDMVDKAKKLGIWKESDKTIPVIGYWVAYDWQDSGKGDNTGSPDHIGLVIDVKNTSFKVLECNKGIESKCGTRWMDINGRYIRGYITPNYNKVEKSADAERKRINKLADEVLRGKYGNGSERKRRLGSDYEAVQAEVNRRLRND